MSEEDKMKRLQKLHDSLPINLPNVPKYLSELARAQKKLQDVRSANDGTAHMQETQMKVHGLLLQAYKKALIELDILHKKAVVELKSTEPKIIRLKELEAACLM